MCEPSALRGMPMTDAMQVLMRIFTEYARVRSECACKPSCVAAAAQG